MAKKPRSRVAHYDGDSVELFLNGRIVGIVSWAHLGPDDSRMEDAQALELMDELNLELGSGQKLEECQAVLSDRLEERATLPLWSVHVIFDDGDRTDELVIRARKADVEPLIREELQSRLQDREDAHCVFRAYPIEEGTGVLGQDPDRTSFGGEF